MKQLKKLCQMQFIIETMKCIHPAYIDNKSIGGQVGGQAYGKHPNLTKRQQDINGFYYVYPQQDLPTICFELLRKSLVYFQTVF
jgi:hypothetical protein